VIRTLRTHLPPVYFSRSDRVLTVSPAPTTITTGSKFFKSMRKHPVDGNPVEVAR